jgi:hypothetical protein
MTKTLYMSLTILLRKNLMAIASTGVDQPSTRAREKRRQALIWLNRWSYSTPDILAKALGLQPKAGPRLAKALIERDLAIEIHSGSKAGYQKRQFNEATGRFQVCGRYLLILSKSGKTTAMGLDNKTGAPYENPVKAPQSIGHNLMAQLFTAHMLNEKEEDGTPSYTDFTTEQMLRRKSEDGVKQPDMILLDYKNRRVAIEIEVTGKNDSNGSLSRALLAVSNGIVRGEYEKLVYAFPTDEACKEYFELWNSGKIPEFKRMGSGKYEATGHHFPIDERVKSRVSFIQHDSCLSLW